MDSAGVYPREGGDGMTRENMNIFKKIEKEIHLIVEQLKAEGKLPENVAVDKIEATPPRDASHGEIATNAAMVIAAQIGKNPREVAELLARAIKKPGGVAKAEIAGPGFINLTLAPPSGRKRVLDIVNARRGLWRFGNGQGQQSQCRICVGQPDRADACGTWRGAVYGDALANLLIKAGYDVTKEYYINDAGRAGR